MKSDPVSPARALLDERDTVAGGRVVAHVGGQLVLESELDAERRRLLGAYRDEPTLVDEEALLDGVIARRAMAGLALTAMSDADRQALAREVLVYAETQLMKRFVAAEAPVELVSDEQARAYYDANPSLFGGGEFRRFEMLSAAAPEPGEPRARLLRALAEGPLPSDWEAWAARLREKGWQAELATGRSDDPALAGSVRTYVEAADAGAVSGVILVAGRPTRLRVTEVAVQPARPYAAVEAAIKQLLQPRNVRDAAERARAIALERVEVRYEREPAGAVARAPATTDEVSRP